MSGAYNVPTVTHLTLQQSDCELLRLVEKLLEFFKYKPLRGFEATR